MTYLLIFVSAFGAATLLPLSSEVAVVVAVNQGYDPPLIWCVASLGNTLGAVVNWLLGRYLIHFQDRSWFPFKAIEVEKGQRWFNKYGIWALLLAWLPVVGDVLTFIAGTMRVRFWKFFILVALGKSARYAFVILATLELV